jgi:hypothetical protein
MHIERYLVIVTQTHLKAAIKFIFGNISASNSIGAIQSKVQRSE